MQIELLSPAGDREKAEAALLYGADAVYMAGSRFGMRAMAKNFEDEELKSTIEYAHSLGKKIYLTVNTMPRSDEYKALEEYLEYLKICKPDALIISDIGVLMTAKRILPETDIHLSTQANAVSAEACIAWAKLGASRIVLARELTLDEIRYIRKTVPKELELEAFIHGSMCISYSGRCLLSGNLVGRDANRGACAQPCRWNYKMYEIEEEKRPGERMTVEENEQGTFIMASKDMCMIEHIPELMECGIDCFKIEGRMRSAYYTACVTNAYRMAMDSYILNGSNYVFDPAWKRELESVSHREYGTGYYFDASNENAQLSGGNKNVCEQSYFAKATGYDPEKKLGCFIMKNKYKIGDKAELLSPGKVGKRFVIEKIFDENMTPLESAPHHDMTTYVEIPFEVKPGDILRSSLAD